MTFEGHTVRLLSAQLLKGDDPQWASSLKFTYEDKEGGIFINVMDDVPQKPLMEVMGGGGGGGGPLTEIKSAWMNYGKFPAACGTSPSARVCRTVSTVIGRSFGIAVHNGTHPNVRARGTSRSDKWEQIKGQHDALPAGLGGKILFTTDAMSPDINVFIANLDGSDLRGLLSAYTPSLSPDGTHIAFMTQDVGLNVLDLENGQTVLLGNGTNPVWSPDGLRIMFYNPPDGLYLANADGTGLQKIETDSPRVQPVSWLADNQTIVYGAQVGDIYNLYEHVFETYNLQTGETNLFSHHHQDSNRRHLTGRAVDCLQRQTVRSQPGWLGLYLAAGWLGAQTGCHAG